MNFKNQQNALCYCRKNMLQRRHFTKFANRIYMIIFFLNVDSKLISIMFLQTFVHDYTVEDIHPEACSVIHRAHWVPTRINPF